MKKKAWKNFNESTKSFNIKKAFLSEDNKKEVKLHKLTCGHKIIFHWISRNDSFIKEFKAFDRQLILLKKRFGIFQINKKQKRFWFEKKENNFNFEIKNESRWSVKWRIGPWCWALESFFSRLSTQERMFKSFLIQAKVSNQTVFNRKTLDCLFIQEGKWMKMSFQLEKMKQLELAVAQWEKLQSQDVENVTQIY